MKENQVEYGDVVSTEIRTGILSQIQSHGSKRI